MPFNGVLGYRGTKQHSLYKKVIKLIEAICKSYLWAGQATVTNRALVAGDKLCLPRGA
ncbi:hypothetical protein HAX54_010626, partial [Datura stramonium]|nr:hypothetical protein [Datura stramonium]